MATAPDARGELLSFDWLGACQRAVEGLRDVLAANPTSTERVIETGETGGAADSSGTTAAEGTHADAAKVTLADRRVPIRLDFAGLVIGRNSVVDDDIGTGCSADRAVLVMEHRAAPAGPTAKVGRPPALHRREIHRLRIDEFHASDGILGADPEAGIHQVGNCSRLARGVVFEIHEGDVLQLLVGGDQGDRAGSLVHLPALDPDQPVLDHVEPADALRTRPPVQLGDGL